jgi:cytoskeletal protein CcmA (bactofilin family)
MRSTPSSGKNTEFDGKLSFTGSVRVDGRFKGEISGDGTLIVGDSAKVQADVRVSHLIISGEIRGSLSPGKESKFTLRERCSEIIQAPVVVMEEGVVFDGECRMHASGGTRPLDGFEDEARPTGS